MWIIPVSKFSNALLITLNVNGSSFSARSGMPQQLSRAQPACFLNNYCHHVGKNGQILEESKQATRKTKRVLNFWLVKKKLCFLFSSLPLSQPLSPSTLSTMACHSRNPPPHPHSSCEPGNDTKSLQGQSNLPKSSHLVSANVPLKSRVPHGNLAPLSLYHWLLPGPLDTFS